MAVIKNSVFTLISAAIIPCGFFVLLEGVLTLANVGTDYAYFHEKEIDGRRYYQENPNFADQFYPKALNIGPLPNTFSVVPQSDSLRVLVLGGSAAQGFPYRNHGVDRALAAQLRALFPSRKVEVVNTAMTSVNSHVVYAVAQSLPDQSADVAVILMGNNEVVGPYGPGTLNQSVLSDLSMIRALQSLKRTRIWQLLESTLAVGVNNDALQELEWQGMEMFSENAVTASDPRMQDVYDHYRDNLADIVTTLREKGMQVVVSSVPVNLRHSAPFLSIHQADLSLAEMARWERHYAAAKAAFADENWQTAIDALLASLKIDGGYADVHFRLAQAYEQIAEFDLAAQHFESALRFDALRFRADSAINDIIREVAGSHADTGVGFIDSEAAFKSVSAPLMPGWGLFLEHVHYDFPATALLAREMAAAIYAMQPGGRLENGNAKSEPQLLTEAEVAARIGFPNHETIDNIKNLQGMIKRPPFPGQSNYGELNAFLNAKLRAVTEAVGSPQAVLSRRAEVVTAGVGDWRLHFELAALAEHLGNRRLQRHHLERLMALYPHNRESYINMAELLSVQGNWAEVIPYLTRSLHYTRGDPERIASTLAWLGTANLKLGQYDEGRDILLSVPDDYPEQAVLSLRAYGNLIKYHHERGETEAVDKYLAITEKYASQAIHSGLVAQYLQVNRRVAQIMAMVGRQEDARRWAGRASAYDKGK